MEFTERVKGIIQTTIRNSYILAAVVIIGSIVISVTTYEGGIITFVLGLIIAYIIVETAKNSVARLGMMAEMSDNIYAILQSIGGDIQTIQSESLSSDSEHSTEAVNESLQNVFLSDVKDSIDSEADLSSIVTDVVLENKTLKVFANLDNTDISANSDTEDTVLSYVSSITDIILSMFQYDEVWNIIIVDFGDIGFVKNTKDNIVDEGYTRYFENFNIQKKDKERITK